MIPVFDSPLGVFVPEPEDFIHSHRPRPVIAWIDPDGEGIKGDGKFDEVDALSARRFNSILEMGRDAFWPRECCRSKMREIPLLSLFP